MNGQRWIKIKTHRIPALCLLVGPVTVHSFVASTANILITKKQKQLIDEVGFEHD